MHVEVRDNRDDLVAKLLAENARLMQAVAQHGVILPAAATPKDRLRPPSSPAPTVSSNKGSPGPTVASNKGSPGPTVSSNKGSAGPDTVSSNKGNPGPTVSSNKGSPGPTVSSNKGSPGPTVSTPAGASTAASKETSSPTELPPLASSLQPGDAPEAEQKKIMQTLKSANPQLMHAKYDIDGEDFSA